MNEVAIRNEAPAEMSVRDVESQIVKIQELMAKVMKADEHYGIIPGTGKKPSLLKPGAEKICFIFRLEPEYTIERHELPEGHREFNVTCTLRQIGSGIKVGEGVGSCSTMETKYRYRNVADYEIQDTPIPKDAKEKKAEYRKQGFGMKQIDGQWHWVKYTNTEKAENPDIADVYNTVLKMAKKRAYVDATLTATAASDFFTQDVEDFTTVKYAEVQETVISRGDEDLEAEGRDLVRDKEITKSRRDELWKMSGNNKARYVELLRNEPEVPFQGVLK